MFSATALPVVCPFSRQAMSFLKSRINMRSHGARLAVASNPNVGNMQGLRMRALYFLHFSQHWR
jgi:hypothetical protein